MSKKCHTIGLFGHYGNRNLGDEAIIAAVIQNVQQRFPKATLICFSINPTDTQQRHQLATYPIRAIADKSPRLSAQKQATTLEDPTQDDPFSTPEKSSWLETIKASLKKNPVLYRLLKTAAQLPLLAISFGSELRFLRRSYQALKPLDLLLICGSNQFLDNFGGPWAFPYTLLKWSILAKLRGIKIAYVSLGAGPITSPFSYFLIRCALLFSDYTSFRDHQSKQLIEKKGFRGGNHVYPDLAFSLNVDSGPPCKNKTKAKARPVVGINPMPVHDRRYWHTENTHKYRLYVEKIACFSAKLLREGYPIIFFGTQPKDENVIVDILNALRKQGFDPEFLKSLGKESHSVKDLIRIIQSADLLIATRYHGTILPLLAQKPVVGLCYGPKTTELLKSTEGAPYALELDSFRIEELVACFNKLERCRDDIEQRIKSNTLEYAKLLHEQYDLLFKTLIPNA